MLFALVGLLAGYLALFIWTALRVRCPKCNRRVLDQPSQPPYPQEFFGLGGSAATVLKIVANRVFRCVHCGQSFTTKRSAAAPPNKPLERAGMNCCGEDSRRRAGRSAPSRYTD